MRYATGLLIFVLAAASASGEATNVNPANSSISSFAARQSLPTIIQQINAQLDKIQNLLDQITTPLQSGSVAAGIVISELARIKVTLSLSMDHYTRSSIIGPKSRNDYDEALHKVNVILDTAAAPLGTTNREIADTVYGSWAMTNYEIYDIPLSLHSLLQIIAGIVTTI